MSYPSKFDAPNRAKIGKSLKDIEKLLGSQGRGAWPNNSVTLLERAFGEIYRALDKGDTKDKMAFFNMSGFGTFSKIFAAMSEQKTSCVIPLKSVNSCSRTWALACKGHRANMEFVLKNNYLTNIIDILHDRLEILVPGVNDLNGDDPETDPEEVPPQPGGPLVDPIARGIMSLLAQCLEELSSILKKEGKSVEQSKAEDLNVRVQDQVSYMVSIGIVDMLAKYLYGVQDPIDAKPEVGEFILASMQLLSALTGLAESLLVKSSPKAAPSDPTHLLQAFQVTDLAGTVSMLYGILLHQGVPPRGEGIEPPKLPGHTIQVVIATAQLLYRMVRQHLTMVQDVLGQEGISLEFRHIASYLLWYCQHHTEEKELLHLIIVLVGYFAAKHSDNQIIVQSGHQPSVLQQLCNLPFPYFSQPDLKLILFPTLISACHENESNVGILTEEMSYQLLEDFIQCPEGKDNHLVQMIVSK